MDAPWANAVLARPVVPDRRPSANSKFVTGVTATGSG